MKRLLWSFGIGIGFLLIAATVVLTMRSENPVALIEVVDPTGRPVAGASIIPDGLRPKRDGGHYFWSESRDPKPERVTTDAKGMARVTYPFYTAEKLETGEISFRVEHPEYCADRPFRTVNAAPPANAPWVEKAFYWTKVLVRNLEVRPEKVVLKPGAVVEVSGFLTESNQLITPLIPQITEASPFIDLWKESRPGIWVTRRIPEGEQTLRLLHKTADAVYFSDEVFFTAMPQMTNRFHLKLSRSSKLMGRLDASVPRPTEEGTVVLEIHPLASIPGRRSLHWHAWSTIDSNGEFSFENLPRGRAEVVAICNGFISKDGKGTARSLIRRPQEFRIESGQASVEIVMEPTATFKLTVFDDRNQPLPQARVVLWPNVIWNNYGSTIFGSDLFNTLELLMDREAVLKLDSNRRNLFMATTDASGIAIVKNLPANAEHYAVSHADFEMPVQNLPNSQMGRERQIQLRAGEMTEAAISLQKKGLDHVQHKP